jgi:DNA-directed RNA polymerase specialized sigma24 family protein
MREIAAILGRTSVAVRVMLFRARVRLAQRLEPAPDAPAIPPSRKVAQWRKAGT